MSKNVTSIIVALTSILVLLFLTLQETNAVENPLKQSNNVFGIHILSESDIVDASNLVNSSGGEWGYVTLVIRKDERDTTRWQRIFDDLRRQKLIPLVRIATVQQNDGWEKPSFDEIDGWVSFFNSLNWVIKNRYVIVGNEPNHAKEWGNQVNPEEYGSYLVNFSKKLKNSSQDYFVLPAGLDASVPDNGTDMSESRFLSKMLEQHKDFFLYIDGWTSHSYPNPGFSGSVYDTGRGTLRTYEWELNFLKELGLRKELPVFITETGWAHDADNSMNEYKTSDTVASNFKKAFSDVWDDPRIVAITPFILNYSTYPFDMFSWKKRHENSFYDFYYEVQNIPKEKGKPLQESIGKILFYIFPRILRNNNKDFGIAFFQNSGQSIWYWDEFSEIEIEGQNYEVKPFTVFKDIEPGNKSLVLYTVSN